MVHLLGRGRNAAQPLLQQADAGGQILGQELFRQGPQVALELVEQLRIVGTHAGQLAIGGMNAGHHPHLIKSIVLILLIGLPEQGRLHAVVVQSEGLLQIAKLGGGLRASLIDQVDAVVEPRADVGVEGLQRIVEGGIEQAHLVAAGGDDPLIRVQQQMFLLAVGRLPLPAQGDLVGPGHGREH